MEITEYQEKLAEVRKEIDEIDRKLLPLFLKRMQCSEKVAALKREAGAPVLNAGREQEILAGVREKGGDYGAEAEALYRSIMSISRMRQHKLLSGGEELRVLEREASRVMPERPEMVVCQGVEGAYSHQAALSFFGEAPISFAPTWKQVFEDVKAGRAQFGVLPVENSAAGSVTGVYDLILRYRFFIVGAEAVRVEYRGGGQICGGAKAKGRCRPLLQGSGPAVQAFHSGGKCAGRKGQYHAVRDHFQRTDFPGERGEDQSLFFPAPYARRTAHGAGAVCFVRPEYDEDRVPAHSR